MRIGASLLTLSLVPLLACILVFAEWLPRDMDRYADYRAAGRCAADSPVVKYEDCLRTAPFTVDGTRNKAGRSGSYQATLSGAPFWNGTVSFGDPDPLLARLRPGDRVTGTVWRGDVVALGRGDVRQSTSVEPRDEPQMTAAIGTFAGLLAALAFWLGTMRLTGPRDREPRTWAHYGKPLLITLVGVCFGIGLPSVWLGLPWRLVPAVVVPFMVCAAWLLHRYRVASAASGPAAA
ncbi:hypothetical protein OG920_16310 [Streptomyces europaeiscabiei]|uniref:hypothetical protein n=1 Tax=Streptomyces europaeiscabiei TaxID=146819 RepID=UPI0029BF20A1|nr:hypothetical protein [Streptomyces europaeiscabiei]MDX3629529.1 hypothetical protein [Streptomyces europaeiscabiei]MDX3648146.1 hypothetical protein [Streptomyces europaeiscabiei]